MPFGLLPAILLSSLLYAAYHIGSAMPVAEMVVLFFIGILLAATSRRAGSRSHGSREAELDG